jgi:hypothetical protein
MNIKGLGIFPKPFFYENLSGCVQGAFEIKFFLGYFLTGNCGFVLAFIDPPVLEVRPVHQLPTFYR